MSDVLSERRLNRATLARQRLLERAKASAIETIEHLGGMQSQAPLAPYVGLWTRLQDFAPQELSVLTEQHHVVRTHVMRNTVHLLSARDSLGWRALFAQTHAAAFKAHFGRAAPGLDVDLVIKHAKPLLEAQPRTRSELGALLAERVPDVDPNVLSYAATQNIPLVQVPPRGVWGQNGPAAWTPLESWLGTAMCSVPVDDLVLRYLGAFGPASVADVQLWSGMTRLREVVERLPLRRFRGEDGQELYDLPDAPRPAEDMPAPPRFLPEYDNLLLSFKDRRRVIPHDRRVPLPPGKGATGGTFLVDGMWQGTWQIRDQTLRIQPFTELTGADRDGLLDEAGRLCAFLDPQSTFDVSFES